MSNTKGRIFFYYRGAGFIANTLIAELIKDNKKLSTTIFTGIHLLPAGYTPEYQNRKGDVLDKESMIKAMAGADIVVHAAGIAGIDTGKDPVHYHDGKYDRYSQCIGSCTGKWCERSLY